MTARTQVYLDFKLRQLAQGLLKDRCPSIGLSITYEVGGASSSETVFANTDLAGRDFQLVTAILDHFKYPWRTGLSAKSMERFEATLGHTRDETMYGLPRVAFVGPRNSYFNCPLKEGFASYAPAEAAILAGEYPGLHAVELPKLPAGKGLDASLTRMTERLAEARSSNAHHQEARAMLARQLAADKLTPAEVKLGAETETSSAEVFENRQKHDHMIIGGHILDDNKYYSFSYVLERLRLSLLAEEKRPADLKTIRLSFYDDKAPSLNSFLRAVAEFNREIFAPLGVTIEPETYLVNKKTGEPTPYQPTPAVFVVDAKTLNYETLDTTLRDQVLYQKGRITSAVIFVGKTDPRLSAICHKYGIPHRRVNKAHEAGFAALNKAGDLQPAGADVHKLRLLSLSNDTAFHKGVSAANGFEMETVALDKSSLAGLPAQVASTQPKNLSMTPAQQSKRAKQRWATVALGAAFIAAAAALTGSRGGPTPR